MIALALDVHLDLGQLSNSTSGTVAFGSRKRLSSRASADSSLPITNVPIPGLSSIMGRESITVPASIPSARTDT